VTPTHPAQLRPGRLSNAPPSVVGLCYSFFPSPPLTRVVARNAVHWFVQPEHPPGEFLARFGIPFTEESPGATPGAGVRLACNEARSDEELCHFFIRHALPTRTASPPPPRYSWVRLLPWMCLVHSCSPTRRPWLVFSTPLDFSPSDATCFYEGDPP